LTTADQVPSASERVVAWTQQLRHTRAARAVLERLALDGVDALPVKGIVSARTLYGDLADRLLTDVDLRIRRRDFDRVVVLVKRAGWRITQHMRAYRNLVFLVDGVAFDIEAYVALPGMVRLTTEAMIARAQPSFVLGVPHLLPEFYGHAVLFVMNAFKDKLVHAFAWSVRDLERLPENTQFTASKLAARLRDTGASTVGWVVADWMTRERRVASWGAVRDALGGEPPRAAYVANLRRLRELQPHGALTLRVLSRLCADRPLDRVHALARMVWWQGEALASQWSETPLRRKPSTELEGTVFAQKNAGADVGSARR
jgi:hypothetical protein